MAYASHMVRVTRSSAQAANNVKEPVAVEQPLEAGGVEEPATIGPKDDFGVGGASSAVALDKGSLTLPTSAASGRVTKDVLGGLDRNGSGRGLNNGSGHLASARGRIAASAWDHPEQIVGRLTQTPAGGGRGNSVYRCGPSNLLAQSIMNGPDATARFLRRSAEQTPDSRLSPAEKTELRGIADAVQNRTATFEQLSRAQGLLYQAGNSRTDVIDACNQAVRTGRLNAAERRQVDGFRTSLQGGASMSTQDGATLSRLLSKAFGQPVTVRGYDDPQHPGDQSRRFVGVEVGGTMRSTDRSGFGDDELRQLGRLGGASGRDVRMDASTLRQLFDGLAPGESATLRVSGDDSGSDANHFVTIGRRPDGTAYLYNPDPGRGDFTLFTGARGREQPQAFLDQLQRYEDRTVVDRDQEMPSAVVNRY